MKKYTLKIISAILVCALIVCGTAYILINDIGFSNNYNIGKLNIEPYVEHIRVNIVSGNIKFVAADGYEISASSETESFKWKITDKTLRIKSENEGLRDTIIVSVPDCFIADDIEAETQNGNISISGTLCKDLTLRTDSGKIEVNGAKSTDSITADSKKGNIVFSSVSCGKLNIELNKGKCNLTDVYAFGEFKTNAGSGNITVSGGNIKLK